MQNAMRTKVASLYHAFHPSWLAILMNYLINYCQQVSLLSCILPVTHKVQVFGACAETVVFFLIDESKQIEKGSNTVLSLLHACLSLHGLGERNATIKLCMIK